MTDPRACLECLRRSWLLHYAAPYIERTLAGERGLERFDFLHLGNEALAEAVTPVDAQSLIGKVRGMSAEDLTGALSDAGCWATCRHDDHYPAPLRDLDAAAPWALIARGDPGLLSALAWPQSVSIVGSRRATSYGREVARVLGYELAKAGKAVISGLAFGIDACAHRGAIEAGKTVAVLGCGPTSPIRPHTARLWRRISESGLVISELPPGAGLWRWTSRLATGSSRGSPE